MALDTATKQLITQLRDGDELAIEDLAPAEARVRTRALAEMVGRGPSVHRRVDPYDGPTPVRLLIPHGRHRGLIAYIHGGGWTLGSIDEAEVIGRHLAHYTGCAVALIGYRLAPESPYPAAVEDTWAGLRWLFPRLGRFGIDPTIPIVVAGDSAGGALATVCALRARDARYPPIASQVLLYPATDGTLSNASHHDPTHQVMITGRTMAWFWDQYVPDPARRREPAASPLYTPDLSGAPPALVVLAEHDPLHDEGEAYASKMRNHGVEVTTEIAVGQMHGFLSLADALPGFRTTIGIVAREIDRHLARPDRAQAMKDEGNRA